MIRAIFMQIIFVCGVRAALTCLLLLIFTACTVESRPPAERSMMPPESSQTVRSMAFSGPPQAPDPNQQRIVALLITDNVDHVAGYTPQSIAKGVAGNYSRMKSFLQQVRRATSMEMEIQEIVGTELPNDPWHCDTIIRRIKALPVRAGDTAVVYYAGHGFNLGPQNPTIEMAELAPREFSNTKPTAFPFMYCGDPNGPFPNLDMIAAWLAPKKPNLVLVIADACNDNYPGTGPRPEGVPAAASVGGQDRRLISLFRKETGIVLMAGSEGNNYSFYDVAAPRPMGFFTRQLIDDVIGNIPINKDATWDDVKSSFREMSICTKDPFDPHSLKIFEQKPFLDRGGPFTTSRTAALPGRPVSPHCKKNSE